MSLDIQVKSMLAMILAGFYVGVAYETFRYFLPMWQKRIILNYLLVILFWMLQTVIVFYLLYIINMGELRFYLFIAFLLGVSIYQGIFAPLYQRLLQRIITRSEEHTSELQSRGHLVCCLLLEKNKNN